MKNAKAKDMHPVPPLNSRQKRIVAWISHAHEQLLPLNISAVQRRRPDLVTEAFAIRPFWGWRRALAAAGLGYDEIAFELLEKVSCEVCGLLRASLVLHLCKQHGFEAGKYQEEFPGAFVYSETARARMRRATRLVMPHWEPLWSPEYLLDRISHFHEHGAPIDHKSIGKREPSIAGMAAIYFGNWYQAVRLIGIDPDEIRLVAEHQFLSADDVIARIEERQAAGLPLSTAAVLHQDGVLMSAACKHYGKWRHALEAAGIDPRAVLKIRRFTPDDKQEIFARTRHVATLSGAQHAAELERLRGDLHVFVQSQYGSWKSFAEQLDVPARKLVLKLPYSRTRVIEQLERRHEEGKGVAPKAIRKDNSALYYGVIRFFGSFDECSEQLGFPPPLRQRYVAAQQDPDVLIETIRKTIPEQPLPAKLNIGDVAPYGRLARLSRKQFDSWEEGLALAGMMTLPGIETFLYADPWSVLRDLSRVAAGKAFEGDRRESLFRHAWRLCDSVMAGLLEAGMSRKDALALETCPGERYGSGKAVVDEIHRRRRESLPLSFARVNSRRDKDLSLLRSAKRIFGSWGAALRAAGVTTED